MNTSNKRLKFGASFPGFYLTFLTPRLARLSLLTPCLTLARASQQNTCLFHPTDGESHPSRLRASISSQVTASASRPPNFTFPSSPVRQRVSISRRTPARASRPDNLTFSTPLPFRLYLSDTASLDLPSDAGESLPARQIYLFKPVARRGLPVRHGDLETSRTSTRAYRSVKLIFSILRPAKAYPTTLPVDFEAFRALNFTLPSKTCPLGEPRYTDGRRREHSRPDNLLFSSPRSSMLTVRHCDPETSRMRASQLDNLTFSSATLGEAYPSDTATNETTVGRWQEPPSQTILPSMSHAR